MHALARFSILAFAALLTACASKAPPPAPAKQVVFRPATNFSPAADDVLFRALGLVGTPYRWGGNTPDSGFDCSGLINFVYRDMTGIKLPRSTREMISMRAPSVPVQALQTGDLGKAIAEGAVDNAQLRDVNEAIRPPPASRSPSGRA